LRSGDQHCGGELAVEARQPTLWSRTCGGGPAANTVVENVEEAEEAEAEEEEEEMVLTRRVYGWYVCFLM